MYRSLSAPIDPLVESIGSAAPYDRAMDRLARVIDANANRAREALRVLEDAARFGLDDRSLGEPLKRMRHRLQSTLASLPENWLGGARDVAGDVGREVKVATETSRSGWGDVVAAAGARLAESLRSLEELLKIDHREAAAAIESLRYESYDVAPRVERAIRAGDRRQWRLCLLLSVDACALPWERTVAEAIAGGVDCVQVREKSMEDRSLLEHVKRVIGLARPLGVAVIVNDRTDLALAAHADGVHLGQGDLPIAAARSIAGASLLIGSSAHDLAEAEAAIAAGADLVGLGCMFPSHTKPGLELAGPEFLRSFRERHPAVRHLAIGGIGTENVGLLVEAGGRGVAVSSAILKTRDPRGVAEAIRTAIESGEASPASGEAVSA